MPRPDQVLTFHQVGPHRYELSGLRTGSVRDQILRAQLLVERLREASELHAAKPLLVIGGGAAGVAAALRAASLGIEVLLLERHRNPFQTQLGVATRYLSPTEYDWPQPHWKTGDMGWDGMRYVLPYTSNDADQLALQWSSVLAGLVGPRAAPLPAGWGRLDVAWGVDARALKVSDHPLGVALSPWPGTAIGRPFAAVISCVGFSGELTRVDVAGTTPKELIGPHFWSTDSLQQHALGVSGKAPADLRVLVSGGGDGAQQDVLRILTGGLFGQRLFEALELDHLSLNLTAIVLADDHGRRAHAWSSPLTTPSKAYLAWHRAYAELAQDIFATWTRAGIVQDIANKVLRFPGQLTWLFAGAVPGYCYGLNRLLVLLVLRLYALQHSRPFQSPAMTGLNAVIRSEAALLEVRPEPGSLAHTCGEDCYGIAHEVFALDPATLSTGSIGTFDVLVIRHGIDSKPYFTSAPVTEQVTPFGYPH
jgi:hypothetical protein